jgi:hypothetical protein
MRQRGGLLLFGPSTRGEDSGYVRPNRKFGLIGSPACISSKERLNPQRPSFSTLSQMATVEGLVERPLNQNLLTRSS